MPVTTADPKILIDIQHADLLTSTDDAVVIPTLSDGRMVEGLARRARRLGGAELETEAILCAPIAVGAAVMTTSGDLPAKHAIHVPIIEQMGMRMGVENIRRATRAALLAANHYGFGRIAVAGMGHQDGTVPLDEVARAIIDEIRAYKSTPPTEVVLMDTNSKMVDAFHSELGEG